MDSYSGLKFEETGLSHNNPVKFFTRTFRTEKLIRLHYHDSLEINLCRGVEGQIRLGEHNIDLAEDCLILLPPGTPHSYRFLANPGSVEVCHFLPDAFPGANEILSSRLKLTVLPLLGCPAEVLENFEMMKSCTPGMIDLYARLLLFFVSLDKISEKHLEPDNNFLRSVIDFSEEHFSEKISLNEVSSAAGMTRYHFCRKFREHTGENWSEYLMGVRLSHAERLLFTDLSVSEVSEASGFESVSYFIKCFKAQYNETPHVWRKNQDFVKNI